ncbi:MAG TPA: hypothetical protein DD727_06650 [Clostridiales bacterium]|nr:hypothetical protein [Clostridiales bacterium]
MAETNLGISSKDLKIIRSLAERVRQISKQPEMAERTAAWTAHNDLEQSRPMVLIEMGGLGPELDPMLPLECEGDFARGLERTLRMRIFQYEEVGDDSVEDASYGVNWAVSGTGYGVQIKTQRASDSAGRSLGFHYDPPIQDLPSELSLLKKRTFSVDREKTQEQARRMNEIFEGRLDVRITGRFWWTFGMTWTAISLIGLDHFMTHMFDVPEAMHRFMEFLMEDHMAQALWLEKEGLLTLNNGNDYIGSGGRGFTRSLPRVGLDPGEPARLKDLWVLLESQESVGISPDQFAEFIYPYQEKLSRLFGLTYYGCCEPVHNRWQHIRKIKNLRSVSISPWCDQRIMGQEVGRSYVYSRKPAPSMISMDHFDESLVRKDLEETLEHAGKCSLEVIMKDLHTVKGEIWRTRKWVEIAREMLKR